jgi:hypothetical protein
MALSASCDLHYSVERFFYEQWTSTDISFPGVPFDPSSPALHSWIALYVMDVRGGPSRSTDYEASLLITVNAFSRNSRRAVTRLAQDIEALLRAAHIPIYDESAQMTLRGYIKLTDPVTKAFRESGGLHAGTVDVEGIVSF